jgi:hypothetical protein
VKLDIYAAELWIFEFKTSGPFGMRVKVKRKERDELEEERDDLLDLHVTPESYAHKHACIDLIAEVDVLTYACLDDEYNAHQAAKEYPRMPLYPIRSLPNSIRNVDHSGARRLSPPFVWSLVP